MELNTPYNADLFPGLVLLTNQSFSSPSHEKKEWKWNLDLLLYPVVFLFMVLVLCSCRGPC